MYQKPSSQFTFLSLSIGLCVAALLAKPVIPVNAGNSKNSNSLGTLQTISMSTKNNVGYAGIPNMPEQERYPYKGHNFTAFVTESMRLDNAGEAAEFYRWMDKAYLDSGLHLNASDESLDHALQLKKQELDRTTIPGHRAAKEVALCAKVHKLIKTVIPKFSLDRGFEFRNVVRLGERQCFLQSVLIAGLLQSMDIDAGVEMVYRNERGQETNNGHAVTLVKLSNGRDIIVDASDKLPFARQRGLFVRCADYQYVDPVFGIDSSKILYYHSAGEADNIPTNQVRTLGVDFLNSQFWYYRGERVEGALLSSARTATGLAAARNSLNTSVKYCPENPLAMYMLGRVYLLEGNMAQARRHIESAYRLYYEFGYVPQGPREYYAKVKL